jgi:cysteine desulfurase
MIYLDSNATTGVADEVLEAMLPFLRGQFHNPSSSYRAGRGVKAAIEAAREQLAGMLKARDSEQLLFTSCGTESLNAVIESAWESAPSRRHLIVSRTEHSAVIEPAKRWLSRGGHVTWLPVDAAGLPDLTVLRAALIAHPTSLVAVMWANNETGVIAPMQELFEISHAAGAAVLCDAVQAIGKVAVNVQAVPVDYLALSGHKFHAPKGIGALYVSPRAAFVPQMLGGGQESGRRSGTENVAGIVALGKAAELAEAHLQSPHHTAVGTMRDQFESGVLASCPGSVVNGGAAPRLPSTSSLRFPGLVAAEMLILLDQAGVACSAGSACHRAAVHPSHVLQAMGISAEDAAATLRFSLSRYTTEAEATEAASAVVRVERKLRRLADAASGPVVFTD